MTMNKRRTTHKALAMAVLVAVAAASGRAASGRGKRVDAFRDAHLN
jgi:hypothetical protein